MSDRLQNLSDLSAALSEAGLDASAHEDSLRRVREFFTGYAELETKFLGDVPLNFPTHLLERPLPDDPLEAGETLAGLERDRLGLSAGQTEGVLHFLDRQGLKVYRAALPPDSTLEGFFLFDRKAGPLFVVNRGLATVESDFVAARLYGHYLVDNDPYIIRVVRSGGSIDDEGLRASAFAASFLVSREGVEEYLGAMGRSQGAIDADTAYHLTVFFEVGYRTLVSRLLAMKRLAADEVAPLVDRLKTEHGLPPDLHPAGPLPERYVRFALEGHARKHFNIQALAGYLETDPRIALELAERFSLEPTHNPYDALAEAAGLTGPEDGDDGDDHPDSDETEIHEPGTYEPGTLDREDDDDA